MKIMFETKLSDKDMLAMSAFLSKVNRVVDAAQPFTSDAIVDETSATIPLMDELQMAIDDIGA